MQIPPKYQITSEILELISKIEALKIYFSSIEISPERKEKIRRVNTLKSSLFSAKIEGNPLLLGEIENTSREKEKKEVFNILDAIKYIEKLEAKKVTKKQILVLHELVMKGLSNDIGRFRNTPEAIFNESGVAIEVFPSAMNITDLLNGLLKYLNSSKEKFILIKAFIGHLVFEKIHPFIDGNGRVGRLLINLILKSGSFDFSLVVPFEEYIEGHKKEYYFYLDEGFKKPEGYLLFMLKGFLEKADELRKELLTKEPDDLLLPPRREEILKIIKEHQTVTFDFIRRRFLAIPGRTLRYDLKKLLEKGFIVKIGKTNKSYYRFRQNVG